MVTNFKKNKKKKSFKSIVTYLSIFAFLAFVTFFIVTANIKTRQRRTELISRREALQAEIQRLEEISRGLEGEPDLEKIAREQLGLKLEGEEVVFITREEEIKEEETEEEKESWWIQIKKFFNF
jgi:cell division protein FtsB